MKHIIICINFVLFSITISQGQIPVKIDSIYNFIKHKNIHSKNVNWQSIDIDFAKKIEMAKTDIDSIKALVYVFKQLNDYHSAIIYNGNYLTNYPEFDEATLKYLMPLVSLTNQRKGIFAAKSIQKNYVYLQIPSVQAMGNNVSTFAQSLSDTLCKYVTSKTKGIVLDLRLNGGGQFSSMAAGIAPLLGDVYIGGGLNNELKQTMTFQILNGNLYLNNNQLTFIKHKTEQNLTKLPVAIIIGLNTRSSGSILAISFKSRPKTKFFGDNTANHYTTSNGYFPFGNNLFLNLSTAYSVDRKNVIYKTVVEPDIYIKGDDNFTTIEEDSKIKEALKWLKNNSH